MQQLDVEVKRYRKMPKAFKDLVNEQVTKVNQIAEAFNRFEEENAGAYKPIQNFIGEVNRFLKDSKKFIDADPNRSRIFFGHIKQNAESVADLPIANLSSGETQIVLLFALVAFSEPNNSVFIVDEPELSLHPKWQYEFMESFLKLCSKDSQVIIATHSPEIVGKRKEFCIYI